MSKSIFGSCCLVLDGCLAVLFKSKFPANTYPAENVNRECQLTGNTRNLCIFKRPCLDRRNGIGSREDRVRCNKGKDVWNSKQAGLWAIMRSGEQTWHLYSLRGFSLSLFSVPERPGYFLHPTLQPRIILACDNSKILSSLPSSSYCGRKLP